MLAYIEEMLRSMRGLAAPRKPRTRLERWLYQADVRAYFLALAHAHRKNIKTRSQPEIRRHFMDGYFVEHDIRNIGAWMSYVYGVHGAGVQYWIRHLLAPGDTAVDVGANVGLVTVPMARIADCVHAFEPHPGTVEQLRRNVQNASAGDRVRIYAQGLGAEEADTELVVPSDNVGAASLVREQGERVRIPVDTFSHWWEWVGSPHVRLVKIDVEGFEYQVVQGMREFFDARQRPALIIEVSMVFTDHAALIETLRAAGYRLAMVSNSPPFALPLVEPLPQQFDLLCLPEDFSSPVPRLT